MTPAIRSKLVAGATALALSLAVQFEGKRNTAYLDPVGIPTICYGHTLGVKLGQRRSDTECIGLLRQDVKEATTAVFRALPGISTPEELAAYTDFAFNAGGGALARSSMARKFNAGDRIGACDALLKWVYAGKYKLPGLVKRRAAERELCLKGARNKA